MLKREFMYRKVFVYKEFSSPEEMSTFFSKQPKTDVVSVIFQNDKYIAFYYDRIAYYEEKNIENPDTPISNKLPWEDDDSEDKPEDYIGMGWM